MDQHPANDPARDFQDRLPSDPPSPASPSSPVEHRPAPAGPIPGEVPRPSGVHPPTVPEPTSYPSTEDRELLLPDVPDIGNGVGIGGIARTPAGSAAIHPEHADAGTAPPAQTPQPDLVTEPPVQSEHPDVLTDPYAQTPSTGPIAPEPRPQTEPPPPAHEPTTTHAEPGAGSPRLLVTGGETRLVHELGLERLVIGSGASAGLQLAGLDDVHAIVEHDDRDEYVVTLVGAGLTNTAPAPGDEEGQVSTRQPQVLRTGANFIAGPWRFVFMRDEFADHGRPYGGREGGELSDQPAQPERPGLVGEWREPGTEPEVTERP